MFKDPDPARTRPTTPQERIDRDKELDRTDPYAQVAMRVIQISGVGCRIYPVPYPERDDA